MRDPMAFTPRKRHTLTSRQEKPRQHAKGTVDNLQTQRASLDNYIAGWVGSYTHTHTMGERGGWANKQAGAPLPSDKSHGKGWVTIFQPATHLQRVTETDMPHSPSAPRDFRTGKRLAKMKPPSLGPQHTHHPAACSPAQVVSGGAGR